VPPTEPRQDPATVLPSGERLERLIDGLIVRPARPQEDKRGEILEIFDPGWGVQADPLVYVYASTIRPGAIKGWIVHRHQEDRVFHLAGVVRWGFFDDRAGSPTHRLLNVLTFSDRTRSLIVVPRGVFHAVENIGQSEAVFVNMPTAPYNHANPDKHRLPIRNDRIPFAFDDGPGW